MTKYVAKFPNKDGIIEFDDTENKTWQTLIERQDKVIQGRGCDAFVTGLKALELPRDRVPQCKDVNKVLKDLTGWKVEPVPALIPQKEFFDMLANKYFPCASFIRIPEEIDYIKEPDIFHELYGHCPLLTQKNYADFVQWYGKTALSCDKKELEVVTRLFWFTIEFGLLKTDHGFKVYGGGILSSKEETVYSLESDIPRRKPLDALEALRTPYRYDEIQKLYFYIHDLDELYDIQKMDLQALAKERRKLGDLTPSYQIC